MKLLKKDERVVYLCMMAIDITDSKEKLIKPPTQIKEIL